MLKKFHKWYDTVKDPWRFLILVIIAIPILSISVLLRVDGVPRIFIPIVLVLTGISFMFIITRVQFIFKKSFKWMNGIVVFVFALLAVSMFLAYWTHKTTMDQLQEAIDRKAALESIINQQEL